VEVDVSTIKRLKSTARHYLPEKVYRRLQIMANWPPVGMLRFGSLRRLEPISRSWGLDRGTALDRYYIERFLQDHAEDVRGHVLEIADDRYTRQFGGDQVTQGDILHVKDTRPPITITADLTTADEKQIPSNTFDCIILTQTVQFIYDVPAALRTTYRILKPGGIGLYTMSGITKISRYDMNNFGHYWSFTSASVKKLFGDVFPEEHLQIKTHGNVLTSIAFLYGLAAEELRREELDYVDEDFQMMITVRAAKPEQGA
jgi:SAM-dependent methyltransferase